MICPYICHVVQSNTTAAQSDEEGQKSNQHHLLMEYKIPMKCAKEDCGAWQDGRCNYNASQN